jgi:hypothetical protein
MTGKMCSVRLALFDGLLRQVFSYEMVVLEPVPLWYFSTILFGNSVVRSSF